MNQVVLKARNRTETGSAVSRRLRKSGRVPGVIYGREGKSQSIDLDALEFSNGIKTISETTIVKVDIEGKTHDAFVKKTQRDITNGNILHVDFYEVEAGVLLRAKVSIHVKGNPVGVRDGGILEVPIHEIEIECLPKDLPERLIVDVSPLKANHSIHVRDLNLNEGVRLITGGDQVIAVVKFARAAEAAPTEETAAAEAKA